MTGSTPTHRLRLAVVIPTLNEAGGLARTLASLRDQTDPSDRVVVADAGSTDATPAAAAGHGAEVIVVTGRGRGGQVAAAVERVTEDVVLVGHGDMLFPPGAMAAVRRVLATWPGCPGGCLGHRFDSRGWVYRLIEW